LAGKEVVGITLGVGAAAAAVYAYKKKQAEEPPPPPNGDEPEPPVGGCLYCDIPEFETYADYVVHMIIKHPQELAANGI